MSFNIPLLRASFEKIAPRADLFAQAFYQKLFDAYPEVKPLFGTSSLEDQQRKLVQSLIVIMKSLDQPEKLQPFLVELGGRHHGYHVQERHYGYVAQVLMQTLAEFLKQDWTPELAHEWQTALVQVAQIMLSAEVPAKPTTTNREVAPVPPNLAAHEEEDAWLEENQEQLYEELFSADDQTVSVGDNSRSLGATNSHIRQQPPDSYETGNETNSRFIDDVNPYSSPRPQKFQQSPLLSRRFSSWLPKCSELNPQLQQVLINPPTAKRLSIFP